MKTQQKHQEEGLVKTEAELRCHELSNAKDCQTPPRARGGRQDSSPEPSDGAWLCQYTDFRHLVFKTVTEYISDAGSHSVCGDLL